MFGAVKDEGVEDGDRIEVLALGGMEDGEIDGECVSALRGTAAEDDFPEDDRLAEGLLCIIVGWRYAVDAEEDEEAEVVAKGEGDGVGLAGGQQGNQLGDVPSFADEMSQAGLSVGGVDGVITCPSLNSARFGVKPLIVRLLPMEIETDLYWGCYPASLKPIVDVSLRGCGEG